MYNVLTVYFDPSVDQCSRTFQDVSRVVQKDSKGVEHVIYEPFDSAAYQKSLGDVSMWSLNALVSAGIDPRFSVHTASSTKLDGVTLVNDVISIIDEEMSKQTE